MSVDRTDRIWLGPWRLSTGWRSQRRWVRRYDGSACCGGAPHFQVGPEVPPR